MVAVELSLEPDDADDMASALKYCAVSLPDINAIMASASLPGLYKVLKNGKNSAEVAMEQVF